MEIRVSKERRVIRQRSPKSTSDPHPALRNSPYWRPHHRSRKSSDLPPVPVTHWPSSQRRQPTIPHIAACASTRHTKLCAGTCCWSNPARSLYTKVQLACSDFRLFNWTSWPNHWKTTLDNQGGETNRPLHLLRSIQSQELQDLGWKRRFHQGSSGRIQKLRTEVKFT